MPYKDPEKQKKANRKWQRSEKGKACSQRHYEKRKGYIANYKLNRGCSVCGYHKCAAALEFHHPNDDKEFNISCGLYRDNRSLEEIEKEMEKCVILCANCHKEEHSKK